MGHDSTYIQRCRNVIAALFVQTAGAYFGLPGVDPWDETRDATTYMTSQQAADNFVNFILNCTLGDEPSSARETEGEPK
jgi:hypothetical protein